MQDIYDHIEAHLDESMELLAELVRQPSVSAQDMGFGKAPEAVIALDWPGPSTADVDSGRVCPARSYDFACVQAFANRS